MILNVFNAADNDKLVLWNGHVLNNICINFRSLVSCTKKFSYMNKMQIAGYLCIYNTI